MLLFFVILLVANFLVVLQGISAYCDGYFSQKQMAARGVTNGWAFIEHGGMWGDVFLISPVIALIVSQYRPSYFSLGGIIVLMASITFSLCSKYAFSKRSETEPEAHCHGGRTTLAGWIHGVYEVWGYWVIPMFLLALTVPPASFSHLLIVAIALTIHLPLGVIKFTRRWKLSRPAFYQTAFSVSTVWILVLVKILQRL